MNIEQFHRLLDERLGLNDPDPAKRAKRLRILEAATACFIEHGYRKTSVESIARRADVAKGTVYLYFQNKLDLLLGAVTLEKKRNADRMEPLFDESIPAAQRLRHWVHVILVMSHEMPLISRLMSGDHEMFEIVDQIPKDLFEKDEIEGRRAVGALLRQLAGPNRYTDVELEDRTRVLCSLGFLSALLSDPMTRQGLSLHRYASILSDWIVAGVRGGPAITTADTKDPHHDASLHLA